MMKKKVCAYSSDIAKKVFRNNDDNSGYVPVSAKMVGTKRGRKLYEVTYRKSKR